MTLPNRASRLHRRRSSISGIALVIVLVMLTLVAILLVAFLSSTSTELRSANSYAAGLDGRSLNDAAANIVISQIQDATATPTNAWASQPGMIRTYDTSGNLVMAYKLYSSNTLRTTSFNPVSGVSTEVPATWMNFPDQYVDLNKPVVSSGATTYPIIDPAAVATSQSTGPLGSSPTAMDATTAPIQGCYIDTTNPDASNGTLTTGSSQTDPVPMPVQWLYILQDGTIATISSAGIISNATTANPIVGRIAFWTDDETCKVNVNTSAEGTFWDRPSTESATTSSGYERGFLANTVPAQNEFQRYPGHPAMTSLSVIFPALAGQSASAYNESVYGIIPRLATGGSKSGTSQVTTATTTPIPNSNHLYDSVDEFLFNAAATNPRGVNVNPANATSTASPSTTPFTESAIEKVRFFLTANSRAPEVNMFNKPRIALWPLQANTVTNTVVTPAPACWTAKDKLIAACSTLGAKTSNPLLYYFQRYNSYDASTVRTSFAQGYPATLSQSPIPSSQSQTMDWSLVPRNQSLYTYLQSLTTNPIPGLGGSLTTQSGGTVGKYSPSVCNQILTEMFDFIRSEVTTASTGTTPSYYYAPGQSSGNLVAGERQVVPLSITPNGASYTTRGFGRFETIQQAALIFYRTDKPTVTGTSTIAPGYTVTQTPPAGLVGTGTGTTTPAHIGVVFLMEPFNATPGSRSWCPNVRYVVTGLSQCKVNNTALNFPDPGVVLCNPIASMVNATALFGPEFFFQYYSTGNYRGLPTAAQVSAGATAVGSSTEEQYYPLFATCTLTTAPGQATSTPGPANNGQFQFTPPANGITIQVYPGYDPGVTATSLAAETPIQTINMTFIPPSGSVALETVRLPLPTVPYSTATLNGTYTETNSGSFTDFNARIGGLPWTSTTGTTTTTGTYSVEGPLQVSTGHNPSPFIIGANGADGDVVRSIEARCNNTPYLNGASACPAKGDLRIYAALSSVPTDYFEAHGLCDTPSDGLSYTNTGTTNKIIHSIRMYGIAGTTPTGQSDGAYNGTGGPAGTLIWDSGSTTVANYYRQNTSYKQSLYPIVPRGLTPTQVQLTGLDNGLHPGDWDTGPGDHPDGPFINKPDESNSGYQGEFSEGSSEYVNQFPEEQGNTYSPNRQICSAVAFGSLPTGIDPANPNTAGSTISSGSQSSGGIRPWQTLLFCANPPAGLQHPGFGTPVTASASYTAINAPQPPPYTIPPDSTFLDFFTMPIVEPYAISEPLSSAGKVNMNYQIVPFTYLVRDTAIRAVLKSDRMTAIPQTDKGSSSSTTAVYKASNGDGAPNTKPTPDYRYTINPDEISGTLAGFQMRFGTGDIFRSASEICSLYLVPQNKVTATSTTSGESISTAAAGSPTYNTMSTWWNNYTLTGDNLREFPYGVLYARLTTKSNTYTVHVWTQTLKKVSSTTANQFVDNQDQITSEYRGSYIVQRYLDPNTDSLVTATGATGTETDPNSMVGPYKFRVVATKRFAP